MNASIKKKLIAVIVFAVSMGFLEAAVVVYLRELYYPTGFDFPLREMPLWLVKVEIWREAATIFMLAAIAYIASLNKWQRWGYFLMAFAIWDIIYYVGLKLWLNWPESLLTWDVLFLIPITWVGPVITPVLIAILMLILGYFLITLNDKRPIPLLRTEIWQLIIGSLICIISFIWDYAWQLYSKHGSFTVDNVLSLSEIYVPETFNWWLYGLGIAFIVKASWQYISQGIHLKAAQS
jgi:hypothetical protein